MYICFRWLHSLCSQKGIYISTGGRALHTSQLLCKKATRIHKIPSASYDVVTIPGDKKDVSVPLPKTYSSQFTEAAWYDWWEKSGFFQPTTGKEKFVMLMPPPNVTGKLHIGHAFTNSIQDAVVRWNRMRGLSTLWIPGLDHAGIATQVMVEKQLWANEKLTRHDVGRPEFLRLIWNWKHRKAEEIYSQLRRMGLSLDWSKSFFTMDDQVKNAVSNAFCQLYDEGLISRKNRIVNWSCILKSTIADIEVERVDIQGPTSFPVPGYSREVTLGYLTAFAYPVHNSEKNEEIVVATTRLETMLGDTAIAVHPDDVRYQHLVGSQATHPFSGRMVPIIADEFVDREKGTGAVKLTPAHSSVDYQIAVKHNLRHINILSDDGTLCNCGEVFDGMKRFDAREKVAQILQKKGLWRGQTSHPMSVPICSRSSDIIEPKLKEQWFLDCSDMAMDAIQAAEDSDIEFIPSYYSKLWKHFLTQTREIPWCISRQLWWGHNIPAYKLLSDSNSKLNGQYVVAPTFTEAITKATEMLGHNKFKLVQDEDVLDTWFSSSLLPFASLGWPVQNPNLMTFYPTTMVESGSDILFFWIARMVMLGKKLTGNPPFRQILIHSLLLSHGEKMSKSKGNVIDPMSIIQGCSLEELQKSLESSNIDRKEMAAIFAEQKKQFSSGIPECGSDALRMALCSYDFKGASINIEVETFVEYRSLCNKIWQIFKFYQNYFPNGFIASNIDQVKNLSAKHCWILDKCAHLTELCAQHFPKANLDVITYSLKRHWAVDFSTIYLEYSKPTLQHGTAQEKEIALSVAVKVMDMSLKCLSPFMPYLSEELYQRLPLPNKAPSICVASFPSTHEWSIFRNHTMNDDFEKMFKLSSSIKNFKAQFGLLHQSKRVGTAYIIGPLRQGIPLEVLHLIEHDARLTSLQVDKMPDESNSVCNLEVLQPNYTVLVDLSDSIRSQSEEELEKMSGKLHKLLVSQRQLLDETLRLDQTSLDGADLQSHNSKVAELKKELTTAEKCVEYVINVTNGSNL